MLFYGSSLGYVAGRAAAGITYRNIYENQRVSGGKLQISILIPRRGPCLIRSCWSSGAQSLRTWEALDQFSAPAILLWRIALLSQVPRPTCYFHKWVGEPD